MSDPSSLKRRLAAILAADVVGYSRLMQVDEVGTLARLKERRQMVLGPLLERYGGRAVKWMGDGVLVEFASAVNAVIFAAELQESMVTANGDASIDRQIVLRIGINLGDIIVEGTDIYGDGVNIAARLESIAEPGQILIATNVHEQVHSKVELGFIDLGLKSLKNIAEPLRVFRVETRTGATNATIRRDSRKPAVAVLPFDDLNGGSDGSYFVDGIIEELILELSRFPELLVIARNSSFAFRDQNMDPRTIADKLGVQYIVTGSLKRAERRIRLNVQLSEAESGTNLWAERYDRDLIDIFELQEELAHTLAITVAGRVKLTAADRAHRRGTANMSAYDWYLRGRALLNDYPRRKIVAEMAERAIGLDPGFGDAYALLGFALGLEFLVSGDVADQARAEPPALKAIELTPDSVFANTVMGFVWRTGPKRREGLQFAARAVAINPNDTFAHMMHAVSLLYSAGPAEAIESIEFVLRRDPYPLFWYWDIYGLALAAAGRYEDALTAYAKVSEMQSWSCAYRALCQYFLGQSEAAEDSMRHARQISPTLTTSALMRADPVADVSFVPRCQKAFRDLGLPD